MQVLGKVVFPATFAAFLTRAYDFIRMAAISRANLRLSGSHAGVSIGEDGPSQMALEDLAMMRAITGATVLYPSDAVSAERLVEAAANTPGLVYIRTSRPKTKVIYSNGEYFPVGQSKTLRSSAKDQATVVAAGVTLPEALAAHEALAREGIAIRVIDLYSVKPVDEATLRKAASETGRIVTVEDHSVCGGIGEAVASVASGLAPVTMLGVREIPRSGKPGELMKAHGLTADAIVSAVKALVAG
jgi:transketolase